MKALSPPADAVSDDGGVQCTGDRDGRPSNSSFTAKIEKSAHSSAKVPKQDSRLWIDNGLFWENLEPVPMGDNGASRFAQQLVWDFKVSSLKRSTSTGFCPQVCRSSRLMRGGERQESSLPLESQRNTCLALGKPFIRTPSYG